MPKWWFKWATENHIAMPHQSWTSCPLLVCLHIPSWRVTMCQITFVFPLSKGSFRKCPHAHVRTGAQGQKWMQGYITVCRSRFQVKSLGKMYEVKYSLLNDITRRRSCSGVPRGCVYRRDDHSGVLIDPGGARRSDWPTRVLAYDVSTRIDR